MKAWLRQHRQAVAAAFGKVAAQKAAAALNALVIGIALSLPAGGYALLGSLRASTARTPVVDLAAIAAAVPAYRAPVRRSWVGWRTAVNSRLTCAAGPRPGISSVPAAYRSSNCRHPSLSVPAAHRSR